MLSSKAVICLLLASFALADINKLYSSVLNGEQALSQGEVNKMYELFLDEFKDGSGQTPSGTFLSTTQDDRKRIFAQTVEEIIAHNTNPNYNFKKGINSFSDMTNEEFYQYFNILKDPQHCSATDRKTSLLEKQFGLDEIPQHFDWRDFGGVSPVKNQGHCGSCWTFSTVGTLEAHYLIKFNEFRNLSEQQLVDCASAFDNHGCNGGLPSHAFEYILYAGGLTTESEYPYTAVTGPSCDFKTNTAAVEVVGGSVNITAGDEVELLHAVFEHGPVSIAFEVVDGFKDYKSGVYHSTVCNNTAASVNHAVVAVGFGNEDGMDYWIVKNSWGTAWGDQGFFKIQRGVNMCGVAQCNSFPQDILKSTNNVPNEASFVEIVQ